MAFTYELKIDELTPALTDAIRRLDRPRDLMSEIAELLVVSTKERFPKGESPEGVKWAPKSQTTLNAYGARKSNKVDTRPLFGPSGSLSSQIFPDHGDDFAQVGSPMIYAATMQFGAAQGAFGAATGRTRPSEKRPKSQDYFFPIPWGNIPARPFLGFSEEDRTNILAAIAEHLGPAFTG
jgi:phage gpG-like protein